MNIKEYKLATSIWIFSCNDNLAIMTYKSLNDRISNIQRKDIEDIVNKFPELFQVRIPKKHLDNWKEDMKNKNNRPKHIAILNEVNQELEINKITLNDIFRNRFRNSQNAIKTEQEILKWGLNYLDDIYSLKDKKYDKYYFRWGNFILPLLSLLIAGYSIWASVESNNMRLEFEKLKNNRELILPDYNIFLTSLSNSLHNGAILNDNKYLINEISKSRSSLIKLKPYIDSSKFENLTRELTDYQTYVIRAYQKDSISEKTNEQLTLHFATIQSHFIDAVSDKLNNN